MEVSGAAAGPPYFNLDNNEEPAAGKRPTCLVEPRGPVDRPVLQRRQDVDAPSLHVPALQRDEEEDCGALLAAVLTESQQVTVQEIPDVRGFSPVFRVLQPVVVEQDLDVPELPHCDDFFNIAQLEQELSEQVLAQETREVHVPTLVDTSLQAQEVVEVFRTLLQDRFQQWTLERTSPPDRCIT